MDWVEGLREANARGSAVKLALCEGLLGLWELNEDTGGDVVVRMGNGEPKFKEGTGATPNCWTRRTLSSSEKYWQDRKSDPKKKRWSEAKKEDDEQQGASWRVSRKYDTTGPGLESKNGRGAIKTMHHTCAVQGKRQGGMNVSQCRNGP